MIGQLDAETLPYFSLSLVAKNTRNASGNEPQAYISVFILDENDNKPYFSGSMNFELSEDDPYATAIGQLIAKDPDSSSILTYTKTSVESRIVINYLSGV